MPYALRFAVVHRPVGRVESGAFFLDIGGGQVDSDLRGRNVVTAIFQRGADAVAAFSNGGIGEADGVEVVLVGLDARAVDLDLDDVGVDALNGGAESFIEHEVGLLRTPESCGATQWPEHTKS